MLRTRTKEVQLVLARHECKGFLNGILINLIYLFIYANAHKNQVNAYLDRALSRHTACNLLEPRFFNLLWGRWLQAKLGNEGHGEAVVAGIRDLALFVSIWKGPLKPTQHASSKPVFTTDPASCDEILFVLRFKKLNKGSSETVGVHLKSRRSIHIHVKACKLIISDGELACHLLQVPSVAAKLADDLVHNPPRSLSHLCKTPRQPTGKKDSSRFLEVRASVNMHPACIKIYASVAASKACFCYPWLVLSLSTYLQGV